MILLGFLYKCVRRHIKLDIRKFVYNVKVDAGIVQTAENTVEVFFQGAKHSYEKIVTSEN
ncbi:hypothetical protein GGR94_003686 [Sulfitobacter geojensis]|nr:hypothetical protein [Sulfitobacter geojensis]